VKVMSTAEWINTIKSSILSAGDSVGTGGAPSFASYDAHGNTSIPNNYMRRTSDDAPVLPLFPHAYLPDGDYKLRFKISSDTVLQWHVTSIEQTLTFTWAHPLYVTHPYESDTYLYARFVTYLGQSDLSARGSNLFDTAYAYHKCAATGAVATVQFEALSGYPDCVQGEGTLSEDDFFIDVNILFGIPAPMKDTLGVGGFQAWQFTEFSGLPPNCTGEYGDANISPNLWAFGFWAGQMPYVSHTDAGYDPLQSNAQQGKWLAEFGITRSGGVLPAFAFSFMPKILPLVAPKGLGSSFPYFVMGEEFDARSETSDMYNMDKATSVTTFMMLVGQGSHFHFLFYSLGMHALYTICGVYLIVYAFVPTLVYALYRMKADV